MKARAVLFDIYNTLLAVNPPPPDAEEQWVGLWEKLLKAKPRLSLAQFALGCDAIIAREHARACATGVSFPEVYWPELVREVIPGARSLSAGELDEFIYRQTCLWHTVRLTSDAADLLRDLAKRKVILGLVSNCQPYTLRELDVELARMKLERALFLRELCFFSFEHGFSKPNPHAFRILTFRLRALGISPSETLMVGDRPDNDIAPARAQGWQTWLLTREDARTAEGGSWSELARRLQA